MIPDLRVLLFVAAIALVAIGSYAFLRVDEKLAARDWESSLKEAAAEPLLQPVNVPRDAFVGSVGELERVDRTGQRFVYQAPTPSKNPPVGLVLYARARSNIPTIVTVSDLAFTISGLSIHGDYEIPCDSLRHCRNILIATGHLPSKTQ